jgi:hypothetical protein
MSLSNFLYNSHSVTRSEKLEYHAASHISSVCESFAGTCRYWPHDMKSTVQIPGIHLSGEKTIFKNGSTDILEQNDISRPSKSISVVRVTVHIIIQLISSITIYKYGLGYVEPGPYRKRLSSYFFSCHA